jgi:hypothetical protein
MRSDQIWTRVSEINRFFRDGAAATCIGVCATNCVALIGHDRRLMSSAFFKCRFNAARGYRIACVFSFARTWGR